MRARRGVRTGLAGVWLLAMLSPAQASPAPEQRLSLGFVSGQVRDNQKVEVIRTLPRSSLLSLNADGRTPLPATLVFGDARAQVQGDGQLQLQLGLHDEAPQAWLTVRVMADGQPVTARLLSTEPPVLAVPAVRRHLGLEVTAPARLLLPRDVSRDFEVTADITGWSAPPDSVPAPDPAPAPDIPPSLPLVPLQPAQSP